MVHNSKGQSSLEYLMTYGWAILIIVVVAVILYSMGIFSPSSAVSRTTTGFAPFTNIATVCNSTTLISKFGLVLSSPSDIAEITSFTVKGQTGINTTITIIEKNLGNFTDNDILTAEFPLSCISGVGFMVSGSINYTIITAAGKVNYTATGTLAGTGS